MAVRRPLRVLSFLYGGEGYLTLVEEHTESIVRDVSVHFLLWWPFGVWVALLG